MKLLKHKRSISILKKLGTGILSKGSPIFLWFETQKKFYEGTVTVVDNYYKILYDDGDQEDATLDELVDIIMPETARGQ